MHVSTFFTYIYSRVKHSKIIPA